MTNRNGGAPFPLPQSLDCEDQRAMTLAVEDIDYLNKHHLPMNTSGREANGERTSPPPGKAGVAATTSGSRPLPPFIVEITKPARLRGQQSRGGRGT